MDTLFPFGFEFATGFYLTFFVLTLVVAVFFMNYVLAGTMYLAVQSILKRDTEDNPLSSLLRDWLPFMLSGAITAGIAPLLFLQILYKEQFYTANVLLFHRWMSMLPVLIVGFYLLYLWKSKLVWRWSPAARIGLGVGVFFCFAFVAWSWTENHLLSLQESEWAAHYGSGAVFYSSAELLPRLALWFVGAFPTMALIVGWQLWFTQPKPIEETLLGSRRTASLALVGLVLSIIAAAVYYTVLSDEIRKVITSAFGWPWLVLAILGVIVELIAWGLQYRNGTLQPRWLLTASVGRFLAILGATVVRECQRLAILDVETLAPGHKAVTEVGGRWAFFFFVVVNSGLIVYSILLVKKNLQSESDA